MNENYFKYEHTYSFMRHSTLMPNRITLLFLHGIGDSGISYLPFFAPHFLKDFNILVPDLLGHGKSSTSNNYDFNLQCMAIIEQIKSLERDYRFQFENIVLVAHSMGGIHAMILAKSIIQDQIKGIVNIEGSITQYGSFVSEIVSRVHDEGCFDQWFHEFKEINIFNNYIKKFPMCRSYYASLSFCIPMAFLQNALQMRQIALEGSGKYTNTAGYAFAEINLPKVYCYGDQSLCAESIDFLNINNLPTQVFYTKNHFVMLDCFAEFIKFLVNWIEINI